MIILSTISDQWKSRAIIVSFYNLFYFFSYTGHCPTLRFRVGKRFGACTQEIMKVRVCKY